jgi:UDP-N-acetyl-D-galactosamine dehydrogenase
MSTLSPSPAEVKVPPEPMINKHKLKVAVIGLGYVGAPLAIALAKSFEVVGYDINRARVDELQVGEDSTHELDLGELITTSCAFTCSLDDIASCEVYIITVPTPVTEANVPDLRPVQAASQAVSGLLKRGDLVIYESTVYPGVTEEVCVPILERGSKLEWKVDFNVGYSPERVNPGDKVHTLTTTTKVVSGDTAETLERVDALYSAITKTYKAATIKVAEAAKVIENTQRDVNIALMNELSQIFNRLEIDTNDVIDAAASKWNFLPFRPGLVGGHCISVDPFYLTHRATMAGYNADLILASRQINDDMIEHIVNETVRMMFIHEIGSHNTIVTIVGCTFKENVPDIRNSKVFKIAEQLKANFGLQVQLYDPWADIAEVEHEYGLTHAVLPQLLKPSEVIILAVPHQLILDEGWPGIERLAAPGQFVLLDVKSALDRTKAPARCKLWRP